MPELILNLHMHTRYSDGSGSHRQIGQAALQTGVDIVIVTDHNVWVQEAEGYQTIQAADGSERRVLVLVGEEVHDATRQPQKNHLLVFGAGREMSTFAPQPQTLIDQVRRQGGLSFLAHPYDPELKVFHEPDISWVDWQVRDFTGIELWNGFSEMKHVVHSRLQGLFYVYFPRLINRGPLPQTLKKWDELTQAGQKVVAVGGSDAHALPMRMGPIRRTVFPYAFHFQTVNTHLITDQLLTGDLTQDRQTVYTALRQGHAFVGFDLPAPTRGFHFTAQAKDGLFQMGDDLRLGTGVTLQVRLPQKVECRLIRSGQVIKTWRDRDVCTYIATQPGVYRVECSIQHLGLTRGWIYSNPIYIRP